MQLQEKNNAHPHIPRLFFKLRCQYKISHFTSFLSICYLTTENGRNKCVRINILSKQLVRNNLLIRTGTVKIPISVIREKMDLNLRERTNDTLTRCNTCTSIPEVMKSAKSENERRDADEVLKKHHRLIRYTGTLENHNRRRK